jgi:cobalt-zinc-cadmium efflux system outer membrane protein
LTAAYLDTNELDRKARTVSLALRIPLWGFNSGPIRTAKAEREAALLDEARLKAEIASKGEEAYQGYALAFAQAKSYETDLLPSAEKSLKIATFSYAQGELSLLDLLDARRTYLDSVEEYNDVLYQFEAARAQLERLIGGSLNE